jgi:hypothetical protein
MTRIVAGLGGFLGRKSDGHPGPQALWAGRQKPMDDVDSIHSLREAFDLDFTDLKIPSLRQPHERAVPAG